MVEPTFFPPLPARIAPVAAQAAFEAVGGDTSAFLGFIHARGGVLVDDSVSSSECAVTFVHPVGRSGEVAVVLVDTITHMLRDQLEHFVLERQVFGGVGFHVGTFLLPRGLRATTSLLVEREFDAGVARDRKAWRSVYDRTVSLHGAGEVVRSGTAGTASVMALPGALPSPFTRGEVTGLVLNKSSENLESSDNRGSSSDAEPSFNAEPSLNTVSSLNTGPSLKKASRDDLEPDEAETHVQMQVHSARLDHTVFGFPMEVWAVVPPESLGAPTGLLMVSDGERWRAEYPLVEALGRLHASGTVEPTVTLFFAPTNPDHRAEVLGMQEALARFITQDLLPWAQTFADLPNQPDRRVIAGSSLGGLAAADFVRRAPEVAGGAVVQSGAFWWPGDNPDGIEGEQLRLWERDAASLAGRVRIFQEVGDLEGYLLHDNRAFRDLAAAGGVDIVYREYTGGHDFACWRVGILDAIRHFFPAAGSSHPLVAANNAGTVRVGEARS